MAQDTPTTLPVSELTVVAQEAKIVGDEDLNVREATVGVTSEKVDAQVAQPREGDADKVNVHEVVVVTDEVITDPASPLAVQVPEAGRGSLELPIHALSNPTVEQRFTQHAKDEADAAKKATRSKP